jgi:hypothetical protein
MGIKNYLKNIDKKGYNKGNKEENRYDAIYFDSNYLIHYLIYNCGSDEDLYEKLEYFITFIIRRYDSKKIYIIFDGECEDKENNPKLLTHKKRYEDKEESDRYDKQSIKPKCELILKFKNKFIEILNKNDKKNIMIDDDYKKGEGDIKIMNSIYENRMDDKKIMIFTIDSDLILIAYNLCFMDKKELNINILCNTKPINIIDIRSLNKNYDYDYILLSLLLGNDYLPKISNIKYENLFDNYDIYYNIHNKRIIYNNNIDMDNLCYYISIIICNKKIKYNYKKINKKRFDIYINNLLWCLGNYKVISNNYKYIQDSLAVINIYNFIFSL